VPNNDDDDEQQSNKELMLVVLNYTLPHNQKDERTVP
jgi:hypothetical protein